MLTEELTENSFANSKWKNYRYSAIISISPLYSVFLFQDGFAGEKFHIIVVRSLLLFALKKVYLFSSTCSKFDLGTELVICNYLKETLLLLNMFSKTSACFFLWPRNIFSGFLFGYYWCFTSEFPQSEPSSPPCVKKHILCSFCSSVTFQSGATLKRCSLFCVTRTSPV